MTVLHLILCYNGQRYNRAPNVCHFTISSLLKKVHFLNIATLLMAAGRSCTNNKE